MQLLLSQFSEGSTWEFKKMWGPDHIRVGPYHVPFDFEKLPCEIEEPKGSAPAKPLEAGDPVVVDAGGASRYAHVLEMHLSSAKGA